MSALEMMRTMLGYHHAMTRRLWQSIMELSDAQFLQEDRYSHGSIRGQMIHLTAADSRWLKGLKGEPDARSYTLKPESFAARESARQAWEETAGAVQAFVDELDEAAVLLHPAGMPGPTWHVIMQMVNHGTDHRAQVLRQLDALGAPTFEQDLIYHLWY